MIKKKPYPQNNGKQNATPEGIDVFDQFIDDEMDNFREVSLSAVRLSENLTLLL